MRALSRGLNLALTARRGSKAAMLWLNLLTLLSAGRASQAQTRVEFLERHPAAYVIQTASAATNQTLLSVTSFGNHAWTAATLEGSTKTVELGNRVVLELALNRKLDPYLAGRQLTLARALRPNLFILQAADSQSAIAAATSLAQETGVTACYPVMRRPLGRRAIDAPAPNDPLFSQEWHLENRDTNGHPAGPDLNVRAAWSQTRGTNVLVAVADDGVQLDHPEVKNRTDGSPHFNFYQGTSSGGPASADANHATCVAGLIAAEADNDIGVAGVAPEARLASWVIFGTSFRGVESFASDEELMDMFQYASNRVAVQNHSWGSTSTSPLGLDVLADTGVENAVALGRDGKGVVLVRAAGNERESLINANDDGFASDPRTIAVAAVRKDGRATSYSSPGACLLVGAPSGDVLDTNDDGQADASDPTAPDVLTTDRTGADGYNTAAGDDGNYTLFNGTSATSPQVAGVAALILSANPALTYRDVQQVLLLSARHFDLTDPGLRQNGAGLWVSHNVGYGVPDAGAAVRLAKSWINRPVATAVSVTNTVTQKIPDDALRVVCSGPELSSTLSSIRCLPGLGVHADDPTPDLPLVYVGLANEEITQDLHGKAALIQRGQSYFSDKIARAARAGAAFVIIFNNQGTTQIQAMGGTTFAPVPAVSIGLSDGQALRDFIGAHPETTARIQLTPAVTRLPVAETLSCEHVGVRLKTTHTSRADVRVTLVSPMGTRSILQAINTDTTRGPTDWTYWSTQHFYESSAGEWRLEVSDERNTTVRTSSFGSTAATGSVTYVELIIQGVPITDSDADGLDDAWEMKWFGSLNQGPTEDPDEDGSNNAREQLLGTDPAEPVPVRLTAVAGASGLSLRLRGTSGISYVLQESEDLRSWADVETVTVQASGTAQISIPAGGASARFFRVTNRN